jgi:alkanesulfonate monooxygenase
MMQRVVAAAEQAGFEYLLVPVQTACWEAWITGAFLAARSTRIRMLVAARPGYITPFLMAKMVTTLDQLTRGRVCVNLIAGQSELETASEGVKWGKEERYDMMEEEVRILKTLWTTPGRVNFDGRFHTLKDAVLLPRPYQSPHPPFYLGGGSSQAWDISAKHAAVHLFWGDTYARIRQNISDIRARAAIHGRGNDISFGMRLQIVCRESEDDAWAAARELVRGVTVQRTAILQERTKNSEANLRVQQLRAEFGELIEPNLWTGISTVRPGAGIAIVGNPEQCAAVLQNYIDAGCSSFCLSGYLHDAEALRFASMVRPILAERNVGRVPC